MEDVFQTVTVGQTTTGEPNTNASVTNSGTGANAVLDFTIPRGADGAAAYNPFKGWFDVVVTGEAGSRVITSETQNLPSNPIVGDYAYVKTWDISGTAPSQIETPIAKIYEGTTAGYWSDSGMTADTSNVQTFASGQQVNQVFIDNTHLANPVSGSLAKAEDTMNLNVKLRRVDTKDVKLEFNEGNTFGGYISSSDGSFGGNTTNNKNARFDVTGKKELRFLGFKINANIGYAFYKNSTDDASNDSVIEGSIIKFDIQSSISPFEYIIRVPDVVLQEGEHLIFRTTVRYAGTNDIRSSFYCYYTEGNYALSQADMTNSIDEDSADKVMAAPIGTFIRDTTMRRVYPGNFLSPSQIIAGYAINESYNEPQSIPSGSLYLRYGCTDFLELPDNGIIINYGLHRQGSGDNEYFTATFYNENKVKIQGSETGLGGNVPNGQFAIASSSYPQGAKYVRFNLPPLVEGVLGYAVFAGTSLPHDPMLESDYTYVPPTYGLKNEGKFKTGEYIKDTEIVDDLDSENGVLAASVGSVINKTFVRVKIGENLINPDPSVTTYDYEIKKSDGQLGHIVGGKTSDYIPIIKDSDENVVNISANAVNLKLGTYANAVYDRNKNLLRTFVGKKYTFMTLADIQAMDDNYIGNVFGDYTQDDDEGFVRFSFLSTVSEAFASYGDEITKYSYNPIGGYIKEVEEEVDTINYDNLLECANGLQVSYGNDESEWLASPIQSANRTKYYYVGFYLKRMPCRENPIKDKIIIINHDDGSLPDLIGTRKIYNKYGFNGSFCVILSPFVNLTRAKLQIENGRKLVKEGHELGLHAIFGTYWIENRLFDVTPDGGTYFAPTLSEFTTEVSDGKNVFGMEIANISTTPVTSAYIKSAPYPTSGFEKTFGTITQEELLEVNLTYNFYSDTSLNNGVDDCRYEDLLKLDSAAIIANTKIGWLEYWYNNLIDDTLGYSTPAVSNLDAINAAIAAGTEIPTSIITPIADRFAADYEVPTGGNVSDYYPDREHILNGKMVFFDETEKITELGAVLKTDNTFDENKYQIVGRFKKGLYKSCASTCNSEVIDRCITIAQAFFFKYYGLTNFTDQHLHGVNYFREKYNIGDSLYYDRYGKVLGNGNGRFYSSRQRAFVSKNSILSEFGFNCVKTEQYHIDESKTLEFETGNYYGVSKIKTMGCYGGSNNSRFQTDWSGLLSMFGGQVYMTYDEFVQGVNGMGDWLKYCYSHVGDSITVNKGEEQVSYVISNAIRSSLNNVFASIGTGKVPVLSYDTINQNPAIMSAVDILLRAFKKSGFQIVPCGAGTQKILSHPRDVAGNLFPNPTFNQSLFKLFNYDNSVPIRAKLPDGWQYDGNITSIVLSSQEINSKTAVTLSISSSGAASLVTRIYGLPSNLYKLKFWSKVDSGTATVHTSLIKNSTLYDDYGEEIESYAVQSNGEVHSVDVEIPDFRVNEVNFSDPVSVTCDGCEDNVCAVEIRIEIDGIFDLAMPEMRIV